MAKLKVEITAVDLQVDHNGRCLVNVEIDGEWITVIKDTYIEGGIVAHIVEARGILMLAKQ